MAKEKLDLVVLSADEDDIYRDIARIPKAHRGKLKVGKLHRVICKGKTAFLAVRGSPRHTDNSIKLDDKIRDHFGIDLCEACSFEFEELGFFKQYYATWHASDPFIQVANRMSLISLILGFVGLGLGLVSILISVPWSHILAWLCGQT